MSVKETFQNRHNSHHRTVFEATLRKTRDQELRLSLQNQDRWHKRSNPPITEVKKTRRTACQGRPRLLLIDRWSPKCSSSAGTGLIPSKIYCGLRGQAFDRPYAAQSPQNPPLNYQNRPDRESGSRKLAFRVAKVGGRRRSWSAGGGGGGQTFSQGHSAHG